MADKVCAALEVPWVVAGNEGTAGERVAAGAGATPVQLRVVEPETGPETAEIVEVPDATAVARPEELIVATEVLEEVQVTEEVMSWVLLSE
jgi:hypothetical protein